MSDIKQVLETVDTVMTTIKSIADNTPGVSLIPYVSTASSVIGAAHAAYNASKAIEPYLTALSDTFSGGTPSQADLDALNAKIAELEAKVQAPLSPKEDDEPE